MNLLKFKSVLCGSAILAMSSSCIDDNYDLSNIDTTSQIAINNLEVPINLDVVNLKSIIAVNENSHIQVYTDKNGQKYYAVREIGTFASSSIHIAEVSCPAPTIAPSETTIDGSSISIPGITIPSIPNIPITPPAGIDISYDIPLSINKFAYEIKNIDPAIHALKSIKIKPMDIRLTMSIEGANDAVSSIEYKNLKLMAPKGFSAKVTEAEGTYDSETGEISVPNLISSDGVASVTLTVEGIDFETFGTELSYNTHTLPYAGEIDIVSGKIHAVTSGKTLPSSFTLKVETVLDDITATAFSGIVEYNLSGVEIPDVDIYYLPEFIAGNQTNISLINPQIYLNVNNPVAKYGLECQTGVTITAKRKGQPNKEFSLDEPYFTIGADNGNRYSFCLSPENPITPQPDYGENFSWVNFSSLSDVLSGDGIPQRLGITLDNPCIPMQSVSDFQLGSEIEAVDGKYEFIAPLALKDGSVIIYTTTEKGWGDEDLDGLTIDKLEVTANVNSNMPLKAILSATILDRNGNTVDATLTCSEVPAFAQNIPLTISLEGGESIKNLDGITFTAVVTADGETALSPDMTISLSDVRAKVSGNYTTDF